MGRGTVLGEGMQVKTPHTKGTQQLISLVGQDSTVPVWTALSTAQPADDFWPHSSVFRFVLKCLV